MFKSSILVNNCKYCCNGNNLIVTLKEDSIVTLDNMNYFIKKANPDKVIIQNICSVKVLKNLFNIVKEVDYNKDLVIDLNYFVSKNRHNVKPIINGLNNKIYMDLHNIPDNIKLRCMGSYNEQNEFITWAHNLNQDNKDLFVKLLSSDEKKEFLEQERVILRFYKEIMEKYPNIMNFEKKDRFNIIFDYFKERFSLTTDLECVDDTIETYKNSRGTSKGRANLLTLVVNNNLFRLNCTVVNGKNESVKHTWNQFIDENNIVSDYDLSESIKDCNSSKVMKEKYNHCYERVYPCVFESKNSGRGEYFPYYKNVKLNLRINDKGE